MDTGHTFSPRLEAASKFRLSHGEAVAIDIAFSAFLARGLGLTESVTSNRITRSLAGLGLPVTSLLLDAELCAAALADARLNRGGSANLPVPAAIGKTVFVSDHSLSETVIAGALDAVRHYV